MMQNVDPLGSNVGYVDDLYKQYLLNPDSVSAVWREYFADYQPAGPRRDVVRNASAAASPASSSPLPQGATDPATTAVAEPPDALTITAEGAITDDRTWMATAQVQPLRGAAARLAANMAESLQVPTATSVRMLPVKLLDENRRLINENLPAYSSLKVSYTHLIGYAIVLALREHPEMNEFYEESEGMPRRVRRAAVNLGLAIDVVKRGEHTLLVPCLHDADKMDFSQFVGAYDALIERARRGALSVDDFRGTTVTITNPGMIGTVLSVPRLLRGQAAIIGVGSIGYPAEFAGMAPAALHRLGISKVMSLTSTYDHRVIQGAESGAFLAAIEKLLLGEEDFYRRVFADLRLPHEPFAWAADSAPDLLAAGLTEGAAAKQARVQQLVHAYRVRGHLLADLNPLSYSPTPHPELDLRYYDLTVWDLDREFLLDGRSAVGARRPLREILSDLRQTYCGCTGVEYMYIADTTVKLWLQERMEATRNEDALPAADQLRILSMLNAAESFERFLHSSYIGHKRFSLEGCEALIPVLDALLNAAGDAGVEEVIFGMAHRGRLNVLTNILGKPLARVFGEFEDLDPESTDGSGDVKYHLGTTGMHETPEGRQIRLKLASNPSHLESVNPVVEGMARARQELLSDSRRERVLPVLIHGDAAFAGQGVVAETLNMSQLRGYATGGTVHVVVNNQIGFTTSPQDARSTHYSTDIAKAVAAPILHVNADHPQAAVRAIRLALEFRQKFKRDVVVDLVCYRRWGHNEGDEPAYTQPLLYERISQHRSVRKLFTQQLLRRGDIDLGTAERMLEDFQQRLESAFREVRAAKETAPNARVLPDLEATEGLARPHLTTSVPEVELARVLDALCRTPPEFKLHAKLARQLEQRRAQFSEDRVDWALGENLAFGTIACAGRHVRLSGQDSARGTFSQRHAILFDSQSGAPYAPLSNVAPSQAPCHVFDSLLSEAAVLGFEYGYSVEYPQALVAWEAQFGDFANGAQTIIDQYLASAEEKWGQRSRLVLLLPHGFEGQGPEHSSARLERFLQLASEGNLRIAAPTTPAQYFHLLRRQVLAEEQKPLVIMTPKSLLRHPAATSRAGEFTAGTFEEVIDDPTRPPPAEVRRLILTSGKVFYELAAVRKERRAADLALVRIEQFYPFPAVQLRAVIARYSSAHRVFWLQEEPRNMGAWEFLDDRIAELLSPGQRLGYIGRPFSASPATGSQARHRAEQQQLFDAAFAGDATA